MRPGAMPVIELQSVQMPTTFGKKPRPFFKIVSWRNRVTADGAEAPQLDGAGVLTTVAKTRDVSKSFEFGRHTPKGSAEMRALFHFRGW